MTNARHPLLQFVRRTRAQHDNSADGQLLERFLLHRDEESFSLLVQRHGPMVMGVCRRALQHSQDAEDAFQATFLVLLRKADSIQPRDKVGAWLYGVAVRTALEAKAQRARRKAKEAQVSPSEDATAEDQNRRELQEVLDEQLSRLPEKYRLPILLCDLQGQTQAEAAQQLGWPEGTVSGRLFRGRQMLAKRLKKQGIAVTAMTLGELLSQQSWASPVPAPLFTSLMQAARGCDFQSTLTFSDVSSTVPKLTEGVLRSMFAKKMKTTLFVILVAGISLTALGAYVNQLFAGKPKENPPRPANLAPVRKKPLTAAQLFQSTERQLLNAKTVQFKWEMTGSVPGPKENQEITGKGKMFLRKPNQARLEITFATKMADEKTPPRTMTLISDGKQMLAVGGPAEGKPKAASANLREMFAFSMSRAGLFLPLTVVGMTDDKELVIKPSQLFTVTDLKRDKDAKVGGKTVNVLRYNCSFHRDKTSAQIVLYLDPKTHLPIQRVLIAQDQLAPRGKTTAKITENYSDWKLNKPIDPKLFELVEK